MKKLIFATAMLVLLNSICLCKLADDIRDHEHEVQVVEVYTPAIVEYKPSEASKPIEPVMYDVPLSEGLQKHIIAVSEENGIEPEIVLAMAKRESNYVEDAIGDNGASIGLLQVQKKWHMERMERLGCNDLFDPYQNVTVGVDYLAELLDRYGDIEKALTAYNRGRYQGTVTEYAHSVITMAKELEETTYVRN